MELTQEEETIGPNYMKVVQRLGYLSILGNNNDDDNNLCPKKWALFC